MYSIARLAMRPISRRKSGSEHDRLGTAATSALLSATNDHWANLCVWGADQRSDTERTADFGRTDHQMGGGNLVRADRVVEGGLHRINDQSTAS